MKIMRKGWLNDKKISLGAVIQEFRRRYPMCDSAKLNGQTMRMVLAGDLMLVKMGGRQVYELWNRRDVSARLQGWNLRVATQCHPIPPLPGEKDRNTEVLGLAKQLLITQHLGLVGDGSPRKFG